MGEILAFLIRSIANVLESILFIYEFILIGAVIVTWVSPDQFNPIVQFLRQATDPFFRKVREIIPFRMVFSGFDFSPIIAFMVLKVGGGLIVHILMKFAVVLG